MSLKMGELFAGYGGLGMGVSAVLDTELAWVSEFDKGPSKILAHRFPGVPNHGDITKIDWSQVEPVDILTGGSPCQDLSHAGRRAGMTEGTRSNLWVAMREAIAQLRPSLVVWENVRGAYSAEAASSGTVVTKRRGSRTDRSVVYEGGLLAHADGGPTLRALGRVLGDLSDLGYDAVWHGLRAADVGAPHGRFRVFVAAQPRGLRRGEGWTAGPGEASGGWTSADVAGRSDSLLMCGHTPAEHAMHPEFFADHLLPTPTSSDYKGSTATRRQEGMDRSQLDAVIEGRAVRLMPTPRTGDGEKGGPNQAGSSGDLMLPSAVQPNNWGQYAAAIHRWESLTRPAPAPTETGSKGNPRLSAAFSEWMMGLPADWVTDVPGITRNEALKALGNGVVPQQAAAALRVLLGASEVAA